MRFFLVLTMPLTRHSSPLPFSAGTVFRSVAGLFVVKIVYKRECREFVEIYQVFFCTWSQKLRTKVDSVLREFFMGIEITGWKLGICCFLF